MRQREVYKSGTPKGGLVVYHHLLAPNVNPDANRAAMSLQIITAIRRLPQLKGSLKLTALELAHLASSSGHARVSYWFLAKKTGMHPRTMMRHVHQLIAMGIIVKQTVRLTLTRFAVNAYHFLVTPAVLHKRSTDNLPQTLPEHEREEEKFGTLREKIARLWKGLRLLTEGSIPYNASLEEVRRLEALLR